MAQETKKITELSALDAFTLSTLFVTHNGTGARKATMQQLWDFLPNLTNAGTAAEAARVHNGIYRGKQIGTTVSSAQYDAIAAGTFTDMYIGDYWKIGGVNYRIVAFDYYRRCGDGTEHNNPSHTWTDANNVVHTIPIRGDITLHHVTIMPDTPLYNFKMNNTNTTNGGYGSSLMRVGTTVYTALATKTYYSDSACTTSAGTLAEDTPATFVNVETCSVSISDVTYYVKMTDCDVSYDLRSSGLAQAKDTVITAFGDTHLLGMRKYIVNAATDGVATAGGWEDSFLELPNEVNMYGSHIVAAMNSNNINHYKYTVDKTQFPLFRFAPDLISNRQYFWLQDIATSALFASVFYLGRAYYYFASNSVGVRPVFSIVKSNAL